MSRIIHLSVTFLLLVFSSCTSQNKKKNQENTSNFLGTKKEVTTNQDTLLIDIKSAVFYSPNPIRLQKQKKDIGEENFNVTADDFQYYLQQSRNYIDSLKLPTLDAKNKKYLKFVHTDKTQTIIQIDTLSELWGIYLFDPNKIEKHIDMTDIETEYNTYFLTNHPSSNINSN